MRMLCYVVCVRDYWHMYTDTRLNSIHVYMLDWKSHPNTILIYNLQYAWTCQPNTISLVIWCVVVYWNIRERWMHQTDCYPKWRWTETNAKKTTATKKKLQKRGREREKITNGLMLVISFNCQLNFFFSCYFTHN